MLKAYWLMPLLTHLSFRSTVPLTQILSNEVQHPRSPGTTYMPACNVGIQCTNGCSTLPPCQGSCDCDMQLMVVVPRNEIFRRSEISSKRKFWNRDLIAKISVNFCHKWHKDLFCQNIWMKWYETAWIKYLVKVKCFRQPSLEKSGT
jgi:hypothetical protein